VKFIIMKTAIVTVFCVLIVLKYVALGTDYCQPGLCPANTTNIGCGCNANFGPKCPAERSLVLMTTVLKAYLLKKHNQARCDIANGRITGYKTANRMIEMTWDEDLAKLAECNAKTCIYGHDQCRNTDKYKYAGQNIAQVMSTPNYFETIKAVDYLFGLWFDEYKVCDMTYINKFRSSSAKIGHFTQIVSAGANKVGCAITTFADSSKNVYLVCDYSLINILDRPIYTTGIPCSACTKGCSSTYPGLCNSTEVIPLQ